MCVSVLTVINQDVRIDGHGAGCQRKAGFPGQALYKSPGLVDSLTVRVVTARGRSGLPLRRLAFRGREAPGPVPFAQHGRYLTGPGTAVHGPRVSGLR